MRIDIDKITEAELIDFNHRTVARLKVIAELRAHACMLDFGIGERVPSSLRGTRCSRAS